MSLRRSMEPESLDGGHEGQADARVARRRLDDDGARSQHAAGLGVLDHGQGDAVLDRAARVGALQL
jgi:hypothetical protein